MPETPNRVLDSYAVLALLNDEAGAAEVAELLTAAMESGRPLHINEINAGEVYHVVARHRSGEDAEQVLDHLRALPLEWVPNAWPDALEAARIKAARPVSYCDAFAAATARRLDAVLVTGDPEFRAVAGSVRIHWL
jgi:predicted nucleic acid-binding protein